MSLQDLEGQWLTKWDEMREISHPRVALAAPFMSVGVYPINPINHKLTLTIMVVGKATHGNWCMDLFEKARAKPDTKRIQERRRASEWFLKDCAQTHPSGFWRFYRELSNSVDANMIWTNVAKIGVYCPQDQKRSINPRGLFLEPQKELAAETLVAEVQEYAPDLILFVTANDDNLDEIVCLACGSNGWEKKSLQAGDVVWTRQPSTNHPAVLCTGHPGFKRKDVRDSWIAEAGQLMS